jgi:hypothetical protein
MDIAGILIPVIFLHLSEEGKECYLFVRFRREQRVRLIALLKEEKV